MRMNTGVAVFGDGEKKRTVRFSEPGVSDIVGHTGTIARLRLQLERRLEEVDVQPRGRIQLRQWLRGVKSAQPTVADQPRRTMAPFFCSTQA
jgi:hypothetical protein